MADRGFGASGSAHHGMFVMTDKVGDSHDVIGFSDRATFGPDIQRNNFTAAGTAGCIITQQKYR